MNATELPSIRSALLKALEEDLPRSKEDIAREIGRDDAEVSAGLRDLRQEGKAQYTIEGWMLKGEEKPAPAPAPAPRVPRAAKRRAPPPPRSEIQHPPSRIESANGADHVTAVALTAASGLARLAHAAVSPPAERTIEWAIAEGGSVMFKTLVGDNAGKYGEIPQADAAALFELMSNAK